MTLLFDAEETVFDLKLPDGFDSGSKLEETARQAVEFVIQYLDIPYEAEINITLTDNGHIRELNNEFRGIDKPTDVLSFPMVDYEKPCDFSLAEASTDDYFNPVSGELLLGDIVISMEKVMEQAHEYGHGIMREYYFLIVHSMLHLLGYDHMEEADRAIMEELQDRIMNEAGITRD